MRLLSEYLRVHGLDFLKKVPHVPSSDPDPLQVLHEPLQKVASGRYNEDFKRNTLTGMRSAPSRCYALTPHSTDQRHLEWYAGSRARASWVGSPSFHMLYDG